MTNSSELQAVRRPAEPQRVLLRSLLAAYPKLLEADELVARHSRFPNVGSALRALQLT